MFNIRLSGFDEMQRKLDRLAENAQKLHGTHQVPMAELLTADFMQAHTKYASFEEMIKQSPFTVNSAEDFKAIPQEDWDAFIRSNTDFGDWQEMMKAAAAEMVRRELLR